MLQRRLQLITSLIRSVAYSIYGHAVRVRVRCPLREVMFASGSGVWYSVMLCVSQAVSALVISLAVIGIGHFRARKKSIRYSYSTNFSFACYGVRTYGPGGAVEGATSTHIYPQTQTPPLPPRGPVAGELPSIT